MKKSALVFELCYFEPPTNFSKRRDLTGLQILEGGFWERGGDFFQGEGAMQFSHKK